MAFLGRYKADAQEKQLPGWQRLAIVELTTSEALVMRWLGAGMGHVPRKGKIMAIFDPVINDSPVHCSKCGDLIPVGDWVYSIQPMWAPNLPMVIYCTPKCLEGPAQPRLQADKSGVDTAPENQPSN